MTKSQFKSITHSQRLETRKAIKRGQAIPIVWGRNFAMLVSIHNEVDPIIQAKREALDRLGNGITPYLENNEDTYGQSIAQQQRHYFNPLRLASVGASADAEIEERESVIVSAATHNHSEENIAKPLH